MSVLNESWTLHNGVTIPKLGLGTWLVDDDRVERVVRDAIALGYRHIDTAQAYGNEAGVGVAVRAANVARSELFITTKLAAEIKDHREAGAAIDGSLARMGLDHIDLVLIHSPKPWRVFHDEDRFLDGNRAAWRALEDAYRAGKARAIGVSNFEIVDLDNIIATATIKPMVNQLLAHISNTPEALISATKERGMLVEAYSPVAHGELLKNDVVVEMARRYGVSVAQLAIRYLLQLDLLPLPKTTSPQHMQSNADVNFVIGDEDMRHLIGIAPIKDYGAASGMPVYGGRLV